MYIMKTICDLKRIEEILDRGVVVEALPTRKQLVDQLMSGKRLKIYIGADPTSDSLHLSHAKNYMLLEELRQLGHEVIVLFGDFTAQIGDPTDKGSTRVQLSAEEVKKNVSSWLSQIKPLLDFDDKDNPPQIRYNSKWLSQLSLSEVIELASEFTVQQMIERDMFEKRLENNKPVYLHEFLYPLMQGYDSVAMDVDVELCGTDQTFNALAGRTLLKRHRQKDKIVLVVNLMENPVTGQLMSKSNNTGVFLSATSSEMYGEIMAQPDEMIKPLFVNNTRVNLAEIDKILSEGPRSAKARVAFEIVKIFHGETKAKNAEEDFNQTFRDKGVPEDVPVIDLADTVSLPDELINHKIISSKTEWRRLVSEGAVKDTNGNKIDDQDFRPDEKMIIKIGKRRFVEINPT